MTPFLKQVARHYCQGAVNDPGRLLFVLPSQRAVIFFNRYFAQEVRLSCRGAVIAPLAMTIDDFFSALSPLRTADRISLLVELYGSYCELNPNHGTLDDFVFWGDMIVSDFEDVDKYLVDPKDLFRNVAQLKDMTDDMSYLSQTQREAIERFLGMFRSEGEYKDRFRRMWDILFPLYESFNRRLDEKGESYQGAIYRRIVSLCSETGADAVLNNAFPNTDKVVFCGLNALNNCEKKILSALKTLGLAEFCWDYVDDWIMDTANQSSRFLRENILLFPQAFPLERCEKHPDFEIVSLPTGVGQTRILSAIFEDNPEIRMDESTAIVLPDEAMLLPLLSSIPAQAEKVNVTMGFPMTSSSFFSLMDYIIQMQLGVRTSSEGQAFYHRQVWGILGNNIFTALARDEVKDTIAQIKKGRKYFIPSADLCQDGIMSVIFKPIASDAKTLDVGDLQSYLLDVLNFIGTAIAADDDLKRRLPLELDFAMEYSKVVQLLSDRKLDIKPATFAHLLRSLLQGRSIPFKGEPLTGLQIMGPLEIRALDFDHLIVLSCNEGVFPRHNVASSFIPPLLRRGFDMPTYEYQDAIWAYYFYRMIQRPSKVWMLVDSRTEGLKSGEESRYIKQLQYHFEAPMTRRSVISVPKATPQENEIPKTRSHVDIIRSKPISPSALKAYLSCGARFYYSFVEGLSALDEVAESLDAGMMGNVYHHTMEALYGGLPDNKVTLEYIDSLLGTPDKVNAIVQSKAMEELRTDHIHGRDIVLVSLLRKYVAATLECDRKFILESGRGWFEVKGLECKLSADFEGYRLSGVVDRMDSFADGMLRIVDYKTGRVLKDDENISDETAEEIAASIFDPDTKDRPEIALQFFIYDLLVAANGLDRGKVVQNCVYSTRKLLGEAPVNVYRNEKFYGLMTAGLSRLLSEIGNPDIPFKRTDKSRNCEICDFKTICGR